MINKKILYTAGLFIFAFIQTTNAQPAVIITEIKAALNFDKDNYIIHSANQVEYIEIYNTTMDAVNVEGWVISSGDSAVNYIFPNAVLAAQEYAVISCSQQLDNKNYLNSLLTKESGNPAGNKLFYSETNLLSPANYSLVLKDRKGIVQDSINYMEIFTDRYLNNENAMQKYALRDFTGYSLQRIYMETEGDVSPTPRVYEWIVDEITPFEENPLFSEFVNNSTTSVMVNFKYDLAGNRISKVIKLSASVLTRSQMIEEEEQYDERDAIREKLSENTISIYPNPTRGNLSVEISTYTEDVSGNLSLYDPKGYLIFSNPVRNEIIHMDLYDKPSGIYIMKINIDGKTSIWKIIKE